MCENIWPSLRCYAKDRYLYFDLKPGWEKQFANLLKEVWILCCNFIYTYSRRRKLTVKISHRIPSVTKCGFRAMREAAYEKQRNEKKRKHWTLTALGWPMISCTILNKLLSSVLQLLHWENGNNNILTSQNCLRTKEKSWGIHS